MRLLCGTGVLIACGLALAGCGDEASPPAKRAAVINVEIDRVFSIEADPPGGDVLVATDRGLIRIDSDGRNPRQVLGVYRDRRGSTPMGALSLAPGEPGTLLASGHPRAPTRGFSETLGLVSSSDGGRRWEPVSLYGRADFHPLRRADARIYGFDFRQLKFVVTTDEGRTWKPLELPAPMYDFVVDPADPDRLAASTPAGLLESVDGGYRWLPAGKGGGDLRLAWPQTGRFYSAAKDGTVTTSDGPGSRGAPVGELPAKPQTLTALDPDSLLAAVDGGRVVRSDDGGQSWRDWLLFGEP